MDHGTRETIYWCNILYLIGGHIRSLKYPAQAFNHDHHEVIANLFWGYWVLMMISTISELSEN